MVDLVNVEQRLTRYQQLIEQVRDALKVLQAFEALDLQAPEPVTRNHHAPVRILPSLGHYPKGYSKPKLAAYNDRRAIELLTRQGPLVFREVRRQLGLSESGTTNTLKRLKMKGLADSRAGVWGLTEKMRTHSNGVAKKRVLPSSTQRQERIDAILQYLQQQPDGVSARQIQRTLKIGHRYEAVYPYLQEMLKAGSVTHQGKTWAATNGRA